MAAVFFVAVLTLACVTPPPPKKKNNNLICYLFNTSQIKHTICSLLQYSAGRFFLFAVHKTKLRN